MTPLLMRWVVVMWTYSCGIAKLNYLKSQGGGGGGGGGGGSGGAREDTAFVNFENN